VESKVSVAPDTPNLHVQKLGSSDKRKDKVLYSIPRYSPPSSFVVFNNSIVNLEKAVKERVFFVKDPKGGFKLPPRPERGIFDQNMKEFSQCFDKYSHTTNPYTYDEFVGCYVARKREIYQEAARSLLISSVERKDSQLKAFVKAEKVDTFRKQNPVPRVIQPRTPRYNVAVGRLIKRIEHRIYEQVEEVFHSRTIMKGYNAQTVGREVARKWGNFKYPVAIGLDASRFDQHVSVDALKWEHERYLKFCPRKYRAEYARLLSWQLRNNGVGYCPDGKLRYKVKGCRMSGDMNTGLGNCLIMCGLMYSYMLHVGIGKYELLNNGDDCVMIIESDRLTQFSNDLNSWFTKMGFTMEVEKPVYEIEQLEFCQCQPIWTTAGYLMVRNIHTAMAKDCISIPPIGSRKAYEAFCGAIGICGVALTGGIPIYQDFYKGFIQSSRGRVSKNWMDPMRGMCIMAKSMNRYEMDIDPRTRHSFYLAFDITPDMQVEVETYLRLNYPLYCDSGSKEDPIMKMPAWL